MIDLYSAVRSLLQRRCCCISEVDVFQTYCEYNENWDQLLQGSAGTKTVLDGLIIHSSVLNFL